MRRARLTRSWFGCDPVATQYAALWSAHFHRCFGPVLNERDVPADFRPLSCGDSCAALYNLHNDPTYPDTPSADFLRDCLPLMLFAGFRPRPERHHMVDTLLRRMDDRYALTVDDDADLALQYVLHDARRRYGAVPDNTPPLIDTMAAILPPDEISKQVISSPTAVKYEGHVWTITTELWIPVPVDAAAHLVNPENWTELGSFFTETTRLDAPKKSTKEGAQAWHGRLHETYTYNWSTLSVQSFHTVLKIDYTVGADKVRTDYSLEYEEDDQLITDDGFMQVNSVDGHPQWTHYLGQKSVRFTSSAMNLLAPAVVCMAMDRDASGFQRNLLKKAKHEQARLERPQAKRPQRKG